MLLMTEPLAPSAFWPFYDRPKRRTVVVEPRTAEDDWRRHPLAPAIDALLTERGLDEWDIELFVAEPMLYAITACWPHDFRADPDGVCKAEEAAVLAADLDHLVVARRRDAMIAAALEAGDGVEPWISPSSRGSCGKVGPAPADDFGRAVPLWAVTASTALLGHLARSGVTPLDALRLACARPSDPDNAETWPELGRVRIHYEAGRLHAREFFDKNTLDDWYGLTLNLGGQDLPDSVMVAATGRRLSELVGFNDPPALLVGLDPVMTRVRKVDLQMTNAMGAGLLVSLEASTETLADVPASALAAIGDARRRVPRSEKPWLGIIAS